MPETTRRWDDRPVRTEARWPGALVLAAGLGMNLLIGWLARLSIVVTGYVVGGRVLGQEDHLVKDNVGVWMILGPVTLVVALAVFGLANYFLSQWSPIRGRAYWLVASTASLIPLLWLLCS